MNYKTKQILVVALAVLGAFAVGTNTAEAKNSSRQVYLSDAAIPVMASSVSRGNNHASRTRATLSKFSGMRRQLTDKELKQLLYTVGFRGQDLKEAWAIAKRESNGRPRAYNGNRSTGDSSYGIFQINMIGSLGPERREKFDLKSNNDLYNPVINARIAHYMSDGGKNWSAWHGMNSKAKQWLKEFPV